MKEIIDDFSKVIKSYEIPWVLWDELSIRISCPGWKGVTRVPAMT